MSKQRQITPGQDHSHAEHGHGSRADRVYRWAGIGLLFSAIAATSFAVSAAHQKHDQYVDIITQEPDLMYPSDKLSVPVPRDGSTQERVARLATHLAVDPDVESNIKTQALAQLNEKGRLPGHVDVYVDFVDPDIAEDLLPTHQQ
ncbi:hypothetical protein KDA23_07460 [Candidatus Saccharibacteria bacterium]|nr:hypothetical protein [Candidatus Saccharibacteria bacterium]